MLVVCFPYIFYGDFQGMAVFPFIFVRYKFMRKDKVLVNHEKIHIRQQLELLWVFFFILYFAEFLIKLIRYKNLDKAYREISFEKEAYANEKKICYLKQRKFWQFLSYY